MQLLYRNIPPKPSISHSPTVFQSVLKDRDGGIHSEHIHIGGGPSSGLSSDLSLATVTALELDHTPTSAALYFPWLLCWLHRMPHLTDLTINIDYGRIIEPCSPPPPDCPVPFSLRRLVLSEAFYGWVHLLARSHDTLECLSLGFRGGACAPKYADTLEGVSLAAFPRLRALRMEDTPEPRLLSACAALNSLTIRGDAPFLAVAPLGLRAPLTRLTVVFLEFTDDEAVRLARALVEFPVFRMLRTLAVEVSHVHDDFKLAGHPGRLVLADACRARRIAVSVAQVRPYRDWEKLDIVPQRGSRYR